MTEAEQRVIDGTTWDNFCDALKAAGKIMSWQKIKDLQHIEDPQKEVAAMQFVSKEGGHPHVMGVLDVLQDEEYLLLFMPFCTSGDLFGFVQHRSRNGLLQWKS